MIFSARIRVRNDSLRREKCGLIQRNSTIWDYCHKPSPWIHDALFQPERRARCRAMLD